MTTDNKSPICVAYALPLCENMKSSKNLEVHNILHFHQEEAEQWPQTVHAENSVKFVRVVYQICEWKDRQAYIQSTDTMIITLLHIHTGEMK